MAVGLQEEYERRLINLTQLRRTSANVVIRHLVENVQDVDVNPADDVEPDVAASLTAAVTGTPVNNVGLGTDDGDVPAATDDDVDDLCSMCHLAEPPACVCRGRKKKQINWIQ